MRLLFLCFLFTTAFAQIDEIFKKADCNTLVIFAVEYVLVQPQEPAFQLGNIEAYRDTFDELTQGLDSHQMATLFALAFSKVTLIDPATPCTVRRLQARDIPVSAYSTAPPAFAEAITKKVAKLGFRFDDDITFTDGAPFDPPEGALVVSLDGDISYCPPLCCDISKAEFKEKWEKVVHYLHSRPG